jgi:hypothetical protein
MKPLLGFIGRDLNSTNVRWAGSLDELARVKDGFFSASKNPSISSFIFFSHDYSTLKPQERLPTRMENIWFTTSLPLGATDALFLELCPPIDVSTIPVFDPRTISIGL